MEDIFHILNELRNYKRKLFLLKHFKNNEHFKTAVFTVNLDLVASNQISTCRKLNLPLTSSLRASRNAKKTQTDQSMSRVFLL